MRTILVVDDERELRLFAEALLQDLGYSVVLAESGRSAVGILLEDPASVTAVLMDMTMPGMSAEETFRSLREISPALPIIILSGEGEATVRERFSAGSIAGYIPKPYTEEDLEVALSNALPPPKSRPASGFKLQPLSEFDRQELAQEFLAARKQEFPRMADLLAAADFEHLRLWSHNLRGGGGCFGFPELTQLGSTLERYAQASDAAACGEQLALVKACLENLTPEKCQS